MNETTNNHSTTNENDAMNHNKIGIDGEKMNKGDAFVNVGLQTWEKQRARWVGNDLDDTATNTKPKVMRYARDIDVDGIIDHIFSNAWQQNQQQNCQQQLSARSPGKMFGVGKTSFAHPIPLCQIVDVLVDLWEAEGLEI